MTTDPGRVPESYIPPNANEKDLAEAKAREKKHIRNSYFWKLRWCHKCKAFKPPRYLFLLVETYPYHHQGTSLLCLQKVID